MSEIKARAEKSKDKKAALGTDLELAEFSRQGGKWEYDPDYGRFSPEERTHLLRAGIELTDVDHAGTFLQADTAVVHCQANQPGVEVLPITEALKTHDWAADLLWRLVAVDADKYTARTELELDNGYFIRALPGALVEQPVESCLYLRTDRFAQHVHNLVVVEPGAQLHIITGCTTHPGVNSGLHVGVSEFYVKAGGRLSFTMIHNWGQDIHVRPRTGVRVEEGGSFVSNYILLRPVKTVQMYPTVTLAGEGAVASLNSIAIAHPGSEIDMGGRVILQAPRTRAEIIARTISTGGASISRGHLVGLEPEIKAHLECRGLILAPTGYIYAVPELEGRVSGVDMSHEAAVGRIAAEEIEYLMARGLDEEEAVSTIVRGFLRVKIEGLPPALEEEIENAIRETGKGM
ncbi:MAG: SufD family Fe-S cluster assembly protein [Deltaproteobacteria bacterium]|nr:MAG: SufD family Fe-S cluster assembly protein [Deltaproteobacteria bacterium]